MKGWSQVDIKLVGVEKMPDFEFTRVTTTDLSKGVELEIYPAGRTKAYASREAAGEIRQIQVAWTIRNNTTERKEVICYMTAAGILWFGKTYRIEGGASASDSCTFRYSSIGTPPYDVALELKSNGISYHKVTFTLYAVWWLETHAFKCGTEPDGENVDNVCTILVSGQLESINPFLHAFSDKATAGVEAKPQGETRFRYWQIGGTKVTDNPASFPMVYHNYAYAYISFLPTYLTISADKTAVMIPDELTIVLLLTGGREGAEVPLDGKVLEIYRALPGATFQWWQRVTTVQGVAQATDVLSTEGTYQYYARFGGDSEYDAVTSSTITVEAASGYFLKLTTSPTFPFELVRETEATGPPTPVTPETPCVIVYSEYGLLRVDKENATLGYKRGVNVRLWTRPPYCHRFDSWIVNGVSFGYPVNPVTFQIRQDSIATANFVSAEIPPES